MILKINQGHLRSYSHQPHNAKWWGKDKICSSNCASKPNVNIQTNGGSFIPRYRHTDGRKFRIPVFLFFFTFFSNNIYCHTPKDSYIKLLHYRSYIAWQRKQETLIGLWAPSIIQWKQILLFVTVQGCKSEWQQCQIVLKCI